MKLLAVGGGSGGHVTPVLAVINELSKQDASLEVMFVCDRAFEAQSRGLMQQATVPVQIKTITAGKLRRYHGESWLQRVTDLRTIYFNVRDIFRILIGFFQSIALLAMYRPDVVFAKGGYVCLPMGLAAKLFGRKLVIHDSDTRPGLTNKALSPLADLIATGAPLENYTYPAAKSRYVGVPIDSAFRPLSDSEKRDARHSMGMIDIAAPLVVVTGGGLGAKSINDAMAQAGERLIKEGIHVYHITGKKHFDTVEKAVPDHPHYQVVPFVYKDMVSVLGAADVVVARGSATFLQELAGLARPVIVIPAAQLSDQVKNAALYERADAAIVLGDREITEVHRDTLGDAIVSLIKDTPRQKQLSQKLHQFAKPDAARDVAKMIYSLRPKPVGTEAVK